MPQAEPTPPDDPRTARSQATAEEQKAELDAILSLGDQAWPEFLRRYTPFILSCIRRFAREHDERMEIYVHVCRRLSAEDCRRLRQFRGRGKRGSCRFSTWLAAVVFNLAREWIRTDKGRRRIFRSLRDLSATDRRIFRLRFWENVGVREIGATLAADGIELSRQEIVSRIQAIRGRLTRDHRWRLIARANRARPALPISDTGAIIMDDMPFEPPDERPNQHELVRHRDAVETLRRLIEELPRQERQALRLRFDRGMKAKAVARALGLRNYKRVYEIQAGALRRLAAALQREGLELEDFELARSDSEIIP